MPPQWYPHCRYYHFLYGINILPQLPPLHHLCRPVPPKKKGPKKRAKLSTMSMMNNNNNNRAIARSRTFHLQPPPPPSSSAASSHPPPPAPKRKNNNHPAAPSVVEFPTSPQRTVGEDMFHFGHPQHPLAHINQTDLFTCSGCKERGAGKRFACQVCKFWLHEFCAAAPQALRNHPLHVQHQLFFYSKPGELVNEPFCVELVSLV